MVKGVIWSVRARNELLMILAYWIRRNKSKTYSIKLNELILDAVELVATAPETGVQTEIQNVRIKIVRDYLVYYRIQPEFVSLPGRRFHLRPKMSKASSFITSAIRSLQTRFPNSFYFGRLYL